MLVVCVQSVLLSYTNVSYTMPALYLLLDFSTIFNAVRLVYSQRCTFTPVK